jgi:hypothetical protein
MYINGEYISYRGDNVAKKYVETLTEQALIIAEQLRLNIAMRVVTAEEETAYQYSKTCPYCKKAYTRENWKVRHHDHTTGEFIGPACNTCNVSYLKRPTFIPVVLHNLSRYDAHLLIKELCADGSTLEVIPRNEETYISFTKVIKIDDKREIALRFIDSIRFLNASLDTLTKNLIVKNDNDPYRNFNATKRYFDPHQLPLVTRKGVYPYSYVTSLSKFEETRLPSREDFYDDLNEEAVSDQDYLFAQRVWTAFGCKTLGDFHDLYLKTDVLLLADVFDTFRNTCLEGYGLDPAWYVSTPGLSWDCMLKYTEAKIGLLPDLEMVLMIERGIRGGISQCSHRHAEADDSTQLIYIDANNLYGLALSEPLPLSDFEWTDEYDPNSGNGYILEVDIEYPDELHDPHNDLPLAPERIAPPDCKEARLLCHFYNRERYVVHYRTLELYKSLGLRVTKTHRILRFTEKAFIADFIEYNTQRRQRATSEAESDFYKLMSNATYGKSMENVRHRQDVKLCTTWEQAKKLINEPTFERCTIFGENLIAVHRFKKSITFCKPIAIGMAVLDLSKRYMYNTHYNEIRPNLRNENNKLMYIDTDSFIYKICKDDDFYEFMRTHPHLFDTSNYPHPTEENPDIPTHPLYSAKNKKVLGKFKDELGGERLLEVIGLRSKMYTFRTETGRTMKKLKGIKKSVLKNDISFADYMTCLLQNKKFAHQQKLIRSKRHELMTITQTKVSLSSTDLKRKVCDDGVSTYAYGHKRLRQQ